MIKTVKLQEYGYLVDGTVSVPNDKSNRHYAEIQEWIAAGGIVEPEFTDVELLDIAKSSCITNLKQKRDADTASIVVTTSNDFVLNGDEISQSRMSRVLSVLPDDTTDIAWVDAKGEVLALSKPDFIEAITLAGNIQTALFSEYAQGKTLVEQAESIADLEAINV